MTDNVVKISALPQVNTVADSDFLVVLKDPSGSPSNRVITKKNFANTIITNAAPTAANSAGTAGQTAYDGSYFYVCVAANTWVRAALSTW